LCKHSHERRTEASKLVLLDELVQIHAQQFEHQAEMLFMDEGIFQSKKVVIVVLVELAVELLWHE